MISLASQWVSTLTVTPTRKDILVRHQSKGHGDFQPGATLANNELGLVRAACRWGLYHERWSGGDPTAGIKKWKTPRREHVVKFQEITLLLEHFTQAADALAIRDRALFGLMLFTGCRPSEARTAKLDAITPYGTMRCWKKGKTKNGTAYEVPLPTQLMPWIAEWKAIRLTMLPSRYLFPGLEIKGRTRSQEPLTMDFVGKRWHEIRLMVRLKGLWNYDLRRSLASHLSNELHHADAKIDAILGHEKTTSLGHYLHVSFDAMAIPIQHYADWLYGLKQASKGENPAPILVAAPPVAIAMAPPPMPIVRVSHIIEREEWPG